MTYMDKTGADGDYFDDKIVLGGVALENFTMGLGNESTSPFGVWGIGYDNNEAVVEPGKRGPYPNIMDAMVENGLVRTPAYSLWLDDLG